MSFGFGLGLGFTKGGVTPYDALEGHIFRLDASNAASYTLSGSNLDTWTDDVGSVSFVDLAVIPYSATGLGGMPTFDFDTNIGTIRASDAKFKALEEMTVFWVIKSGVNNFTPADDFGYLLSIGAWSSGSLNMGHGVASLGEESFSITHYSAASTEEFGTGVSARRLRTNDGDLLVLAFRTGPNGTSVWRGGKNIALGHYTNNYFATADADTNFAPDAIGIGTNWIMIGGLVTNDTGSRSGRARFHLSEMDMYDRALSDAEMRSVAAQLEAKWGISSQVSRDTFIIAGQSNAVGHGTAPTTTPDYTAAATGSEIFEGGHYRRDLVAATAAALNSSSHGIEIPLSRKYLADVGANVILKEAIGGTSLAVDWKPTPTYGSTLQDALDEWDRALRYQMQGNGYNPNIKGYFWIQGEQDATNSAHAAAYETNLTALINLLRGRYGNAPFIIAELNQDLGGAYTEKAVVLAAQRAVAAAMTDVYLVNVDNLTTIIGDGVHYDSDSLISLGETMLAAALDRENKTAPAP